MGLKLKLISQRFEMIELKRKDVIKEPSIELETRFDYRVKYTDDAKNCLARLTCEIQAKDNPEVFSIKVINIGEFEGEGMDADEGKKEAHVECNKILFPYTQYLVADLAVRAGFPPIYLENRVPTIDQVIVEE